MKRKNRKSLALLLSILVGPALAPMAMAQGTPPAITEQEAHAIGVDVYVYLYSLVTMDVTRKQLTNVEPGKGTLGGPMNAFANAPAFPAADFKAVVRPNFDTLYSSAYLDLMKEPRGYATPLSDRTRPDGQSSCAALCQAVAHCPFREKGGSHVAALHP